MTMMIIDDTARLNAFEQGLCIFADEVFNPKSGEWFIQWVAILNTSRAEAHTLREVIDKVLLANAEKPLLVN